MPVIVPVIVPVIALATVIPPVIVAVIVIVDVIVIVIAAGGSEGAQGIRLLPVCIRGPGTPYCAGAAQRLEAGQQFDITLDPKANTLTVTKK